MLNECPFKDKALDPIGQDVTIAKQEISSGPPRNLLQKLLSIFSKLNNSYNLRDPIKIYEYLGSLAMADKFNGQYNDLFVVPTIISDFYCVINPNFIKTILKLPRLEHGDILSEGRQLLVIAEALGRMRLNTEKSEMKDKRNVLATLLVKPERYLTKMLEISENLVKRWQDNIGSPFSITDDIAIFTVEIFARTILNYSGPCAPIVQILEKQIMLLGQKLSYRRVTSFQKKFKLLRDELSKLLTANGVKIAENTQYQERLTEYIDKRHKEQAEEAFIIGVNGATLAGYLAPNPAFNAVIYEILILYPDHPFQVLNL